MSEEIKQEKSEQPQQTGQSEQTAQTQQAQQTQQTHQTQNKPMSVTGIIGLVLGAIGLATCMIPFVNNATFFVSAVGLVLAIIGAVGIFKGKKRNKVIGILALSFNVLALILVIVSQSIYSNVLNEAAKGPQAVSTTSEESAKASEGKVGDTITLNNKMEVTVVGVETGYTNYDGKPLTKVTVKYLNNAKDEISYNTIDWKVENKSGVQTNSVGYSKAGSEQYFHGKLAPGGTITGVMYFADPVVKVLYSSGINQQTAATWIVG